MHTVHFGEYIIYTTNEIDRVNLVSQIIGRKCSHYESYPDEDAIGLPFSTVGLPLSKPRDDEARAALFFQILTGAAAVAVPLYVMNGVMAETARREEKKEQKEERKDFFAPLSALSSGPSSQSRPSRCS